MPILDGAGTVLTTVGDLYQYDRALYNEKYLPQSYREKLFRKYDIFDHPSFNDGEYYSYGWEIYYLEGINPEKRIQIISHRGGIRGGSAFWGRQTDSRHSVIILSNTEIGSPLLRQVGSDIFRILNDQNPKHEFNIPINQVIGKEILLSGMDAAIAKYNQLKKKKSTIFDFRENRLNALGYSLLGRGLISKAIEILKFNIECYPEYANGYDSLGEAYMLNGEKKQAIKNYQKALVLNPENANAREMLEKLRN